MWLIKNKSGVSVVSILLLGLLVLSVVIVNGVSISLQKKAQSQSSEGKTIAISYCYQGHEKFPPSCTITSVYQCDNRYILISNCLGVGKIILNQQGKFISWCDYTSLEGAPEDCGQYLFDSKGNDCTKTYSLCR